MRRLAAILCAMIEIAQARGQSASRTLKGLDECMSRTSDAEAACDQVGGDTAARLACRLKAHSAEKQCLDNLFANRDGTRQPGDAPAKPLVHKPPGPVAPEPPPAEAAQPDRSDSTAALPAASGWLISETTSPRDFSPLFVAKLYALSPIAADAPQTLVLRCRNERTEMSLGANGVWRPSRSGDVEVAMPSDLPAARPLRWRLAVDGRTAFVADDPVGLLRTFSGGRMSVAVTDGAGRTISATFDLAGIDIVRARLANACRRPNATVESRGR
jgi:hypothetical protein